MPFRSSFIVLFCALFVSLGDAESQIAAAGVSLLSGSNCAQASIELVADGTSITTEGYRLTSLGGEFDVQSPVLPAQSSSISGATNRSILFPVAVPAGGVIGLAYRLAVNGPWEEDAATFFVAYSCSSASLIYRCVGQRDECPETISEFLPRAEVDPLDLDGVELGQVGRVGRQTFGLFGITNRGFLPLHIEALTIQGDAADEFTAEVDPYGTEPGHDETLYIFLNHSAEAGGKREATLRVLTNDASHEAIEIPLSIDGLAVPSLNLKFGTLRQVRAVSGSHILGTVQVTNRGFAASRPGAVLHVYESGLYSACDRSGPRIAATIKLPRIPAGRSRTIRFVSRNHGPVADGVSKVFSLKLRGDQRQLGLKNELHLRYKQFSTDSSATIAKRCSSIG